MMRSQPAFIVFSAVVFFSTVFEASGQGLPFTTEDYTGESPKAVLKLPYDIEAPEEEFSLAFDKAGDIVQIAGSLAYDSSLESFGDGWEVSEERPELSLGLAGPQSQPFIEIVDIPRPGAAWLSVRFNEFDIGAATLRVSSPGKGRVQTFDAERLAQWNWTSAVFPGDTVRVMLQSGPGPNGVPEFDVEQMIKEVQIGTSLEPEGSSFESPAADENRQAGSRPNLEARCLDDSRVRSTEPKVGRLQTSFCTVFIVDQTLAASAGHCFTGERDQYVEFNVPESTATGRHTPSDIEEDTYPVLPHSIKCSNCFGVIDRPAGQDWAVFSLGPNELGRSAFDRQGGGFALSSAGSASQVVTEYVRVHGYGWDNTPRTSNRTNQTSNGLYLGPAPGFTDSNIQITHMVDTANGNSGSPIIMDEAPREVIGIHVGGRECIPEDGIPNVGVSIHNKKLQEAIDELQNP